MEKFIQKILRMKASTLIISVILISSMLIFTVFQAEKLLRKNSYTFNLQGAEGEISFVLNKGMKMAVKEGVISRSDFREWIEEHPIEVRISEYEPFLGRVMELDSKVFVLFNSDEPNRNVIMHEAFHLALLAAGIPGPEHHDIMRENDWCFRGCGSNH